MARGLQRLLKIDSGEGAAVGLALLLSVAIGLPTLFTVTVGGALFLARFPADDLPWIYILASVVLPLVGLGRLRLGRRLSFLTLQLGTLLFLAVMSAGFLLLLRSTTASWPALALFVWCGAELHLSALVMWSTANHLFTVRQGKRLFALVGSGEILAAVVGGAVTPFLARALGTVNLLSLSLIGFLLAFLCVAWLARSFPARLHHPPEDPATGKGRRQDRLFDLFKSRYLGLIFLTYALVLSAGFFVNNIFYFQVAERFVGSADGMAAFLGAFFAVFALLSLLFRSLLSGRILLRFGLPGGLLSTPVVVLVGAIVVVVLGVGGAAPAVLFWVVAGVRLVERLFMGSFGEPAYYTLYQPLSGERRSRVQTTAEIITGPIAGGVTGVILLVCTKVLGLSSVGLAAVLIPVLLAWIVICAAAGRGFSDALTSALKRRGISGADLTATDPTSLAILEKGLDSARPAEVLYCLRLLEAADHPRFDELLLGLVGQRDAAVRCGALAVVERRGDGRALAALVARLADEDDGEARAALLRAIASAGGEAAVELVEPDLAAASPVVRRGALVALLRYGGAVAAAAARARVTAQALAAEASERALAAAVLGEVGEAESASVLARLIADPDPAVRRAAMAGLGAEAPAVLWRPVIANLAERAVAVDAQRALLAGGRSALAALEEVYAESATTAAVRSSIVRVAGRSGTQAAVRFLVGQIMVDDRALLGEVLWALHSCAYQAGAGERALVERALEREIRAGETVLAWHRDLRAEPGAELLGAALGQEVERTRKRCLLLLSLVADADTMMKIWSNFSGPQMLRDLAIELLEDRLDKRYANAVMPLLTGAAAHEACPPRVRLREILVAPVEWVGAWTRACAVDLAASRGDVLTDAEWQALAAGGDGLVADTVRARRSAPGDGDARLPVVDRVRNLRGTSIFREIDDEVLAEVAACLDELWVEAGDALFHEGDPGSEMFLVASGAIRRHLADETLETLREGGIVGELAALYAGVRSESATALERSLLFRLSAADLQAVMSTRIEVVRGIVSVLCHRVRTAPTDKLAGKEDKEKAAAPPVAVEVFGADYLSSLEKVLILKTADMFAEVADDILAEVAERTQEVRLKKNEVLFKKGDPGTTTYIVAAGRIRIHIGDKWIADAGERAVVGELSALSSEPRTASVTATADTLLLALDQESLFELMWDQQDIVRGIIRVLVARLRRIHRLSGG